MSAHDIVDEIVYSIVTSNLGEEKKKEIFFLIRRLRVLVDPCIKQKAKLENVSQASSNSVVTKILCKEKNNKR